MTKGLMFGDSKSEDDDDDVEPKEEDSQHRKFKMGWGGSLKLNSTISSTFFVNPHFSPI